MDTHHLEYILVLEETGNMTRAAHKLFISQPTLSQFLTKQEKMLGTPLFKRIGGVYTLTPAGKLYSEYARKVLALEETLHQDIKRISNSSRIRIWTSASRGLQMLTSILGDFRTYYPYIEMIVADNNLPATKKAIEQGEIDIGFITANTLDPFNKQSLEFKKEEVVFAVPRSHPFCRKSEKGTSGHLNSSQIISHFMDTPFIRQHSGSCIRYLIDSFFDNENFHPAIACSTSNAQTICEMVANGIGVGFLPRGYVIPSSRISYFHLDPPMYRIHSVIYRKDLVLEAPHRLLFELARNYAKENWQHL